MNNGRGPEFDFDAELDRLVALDDAALEQEMRGNAQPPAGAPDEGTPAGGAQPPVVEGSGEPGTTGATDPPPVEPDSWLSSLPEDVQARIREDREAREQALRDERNRYEALHGRVAPLQRRLSELENQMRYQPQPAEPQAPAAPAMQPGQSLDSYFDSDDWKEYDRMYPGDAKVLRAGLEAQERHWGQRYTQLEQQLQGLAQRLDTTTQAVQSRTVTDEMAKLEAAHPDWRDLDQSEDFWGWAESWRASQPKSTRGMYYDQDQWKAMWSDSEFAIARINEYKAATQPPAPPAPTPPVPPQPESTQPPAQPAPRDPRLSMSVAPQVRGSPVPPAVSTEGWTEAQLFEHAFYDPNFR